MQYSASKTTAGYRYGTAIKKYQDFKQNWFQNHKHFSSPVLNHSNKSLDKVPKFSLAVLIIINSEQAEIRLPHSSLANMRHFGCSDTFQGSTNDNVHQK